MTGEQALFHGATGRVSCYGWCSRCHKVHGLQVGHARALCQDVMHRLEQAKRIDWHVPEAQADPRLATDYLFGPARGQMFGVMEYVDAQGQVGYAKAFSGQYNGIWHVDGWVDPLVDTREMDRMCQPVERKIKDLGRTIAGLVANDPLRKELIHQRRTLSKNLMRKIHGLYTVSNFRGETRPMADVFTGHGGMPTGTGDCCAPKLLNHAVQNQWIPLGIAEFYWGRENRSGSKRHGRFYPACAEKCQPILGFMLCGLPGV